jgi:hypothetical protein
MQRNRHRSSLGNTCIALSQAPPIQSYSSEHPRIPISGSPIRRSKKTAQNWATTQSYPRQRSHRPSQVPGTKIALYQAKAVCKWLILGCTYTTLSPATPTWLFAKLDLRNPINHRRHRHRYSPNSTNETYGSYILPSQF